MLLQYCASLKLSNIYALGIVIAVLLSQKRRNKNEKIDINNISEFAGGLLY
jgi:hypothetical protein